MNARAIRGIARIRGALVRVIALDIDRALRIRVAARDGAVGARAVAGIADVVHQRLLLTVNDLQHQQDLAGVAERQARMVERLQSRIAAEKPSAPKPLGFSFGRARTDGRPASI